MKRTQARPAQPAPVASAMAIPRRGLVVGAGVAGAAAVAAVAARALATGAAQAPTVVAASAAAPDEGYRLSAHVLRYYETTRA
ncbi:MAG: formate dehydrogenase [Caldimonas sp.]